MNQEKYILTMLVENEPGVTARIAGLFAGRGYNIETICGAPTANPKMSRITITTKATPLQLEQCKKQIKRLVNVIKLRNMTGEKAVKREMALVCIKLTPETREKIKKIITDYDGRIMDEGQHYYIFEATGNEDTIDDLLALLEPFGIKKLARSGVLALYKESKGEK
ncbi:acetolactate synthase small subunit [Desulfobacula sp.]|uniref:acetolactate synthase small subunit n=1 Tax=Desulfobacula sp. TaxID=2593537 RepID=UPI0025C54893|nr:acetolactate synthase small subunit [Desulfobacula sp.]MBC2704851.1 acetolactate synthase small subunit [Desulfobacula sp.]MCK4767798.1 acetolactate synthase small subunit [Desulfobacula sp.]